MANTSARELHIPVAESCTYQWQRAAHTTYKLSSPSCSKGEISRGLTPNKYLRVFLETVIRMDYPHKKIKRARGLCRKTGFLHFNNSSFVPSCEWIYFFKVNLKS